MGVSKDKKGRFICQTSINGKNTIFGYFTDEEEAAKCYDRAAIKLGRIQNLNFPQDHNLNHAGKKKYLTEKDFEEINPRKFGKPDRLRNKLKSNFLGVYYFKRTNKFGAQIEVNGKPKWLGLFETEKEAAKVGFFFALNPFVKNIFGSKIFKM